MLREPPAVEVQVFEPKVVEVRKEVEGLEERGVVLETELPVQLLKQEPKPVERLREVEVKVLELEAREELGETTVEHTKILEVERPMEAPSLWLRFQRES